MIITFPDGTTRRTTIRDCTGYVARSIEIEPRDCQILVDMAARGTDIRALLTQLKHRFESERVQVVHPAQHHHSCPARGEAGKECRCRELGGYL